MSQKIRKRQDHRKRATHIEDSDCGCEPDPCLPCQECDSCLVLTLNSWSRTVAKINQFFGEAVVALGVLELLPEEIALRVAYLTEQRDFFISLLQQAIDAFTESDCQQCCEVFASSIQLITASYYSSLADEVQLSFPLPDPASYTTALIAAYGFLFDQIGCAAPEFILPIPQVPMVATKKD